MVLPWSVRCALCCISVSMVGCNSSESDLGFGIATTLQFDDSIDDATLARVTQFEYRTSGDETDDATQTLGRAAHRVERVLYRPEASTRTIGLDVLARDARNSVLASGHSAEITLAAGETAPLHIALSVEQADLGQQPDFDVADSLDLGEQPDLGALPDLVELPDFALPSCPSTAFCEDFEGPLASYWVQRTSNGAVSIDSSRAYRGKSSLHVHANSVAAGAQIVADLVTSAPLQASHPDIWVRVFVYQPPLTAQEVHSTLLSLSPTLQAPSQLMNFVDVEEPSSGHMALRDSVAGTPVYVDTGSGLVVGSWTCLEWHVSVSSTGSSSVMLDGGATQNMLSGNTQTSPAFQYLTVGMDVNTVQTGGSLAEDRWFDSLAVDSKQIGCGN